jgi:hypothetical protein
MKTPMQELLDYTTYLIHTVDSEERVAIAVLDYLRTNKKAMLEKEKEVMCEFAEEYVGSCLIDYPKIKIIFDQTFNN